LFSIPWSIGAALDPDGRDKFDTYFKDILMGKLTPVPKDIGKLEVPFPEAGLVYDYNYEV